MMTHCVFRTMSQSIERKVKSLLQKNTPEVKFLCLTGIFKNTFVRDLTLGSNKQKTAE